MFTPTDYRVDGIWGNKIQGRLFPIFDGTFCSSKDLHGAWCKPMPGYAAISTGINFYHLKMIDPKRRTARKDLYNKLDPEREHQGVGYDYLDQRDGAIFERIPSGRDFYPPHVEATGGQMIMPDPHANASGEGGTRADGELTSTLDLVDAARADRGADAPLTSQLGQFSVSFGTMACRDSQLAVVVIGLGAPKSLQSAVASLLEQDVRAEIVVVNSGGGDATAALGPFAEQVTLVEIEEPVFVGAARNAGIQHSRAPWIAFLAADCLAEPGWVSDRLRAHRQGHKAVASALINNRTRNPVAWAAHLMTFGRRLPGIPMARSPLYSASYDRGFFDRYGYFSEAMRVAEDSKFHMQFRDPDHVHLAEDVRTVHSNTRGPVAMVTDQFRRGRRARLLADCFRRDFDLPHIGSIFLKRLTDPVWISLRHVPSKDRPFAVASWPFVAVGALAFLAGTLISYSQARTAGKAFRRSRRLARQRDPEAAIKQAERAIALRPVTASYHQHLGGLLQKQGDRDPGAREIYRSFDISRDAVRRAYGIGSAVAVPKTASQLEAAAPATLASEDVPCADLQIIVLPSSGMQTSAAFVHALMAQVQARPGTEVIVVDCNNSAGAQPALRQVVDAHAPLARLIRPEDLRGILTADPDQGFTVITNDACVLPADWLSWLDASIDTFPEVDFFHGDRHPESVGARGLIARASRSFEKLQPGLPGYAPITGASFTNWACKRSVLAHLMRDPVDTPELLHAAALTHRVLATGARHHHARDWRTGVQAENSLIGLCKRHYRYGYHAAGHAVRSGQVDGARRAGTLRGAVSAIRAFVRQARDLEKTPQQTLLEQAGLSTVSLIVGSAQQLGWLTGLRRSGHR